MVAAHPPFSAGSCCVAMHYTKFPGKVNSNYSPDSSEFPIDPRTGAKRIGSNQPDARMPKVCSPLTIRLATGKLVTIARNKQNGGSFKHLPSPARRGGTTLEYQVAVSVMVGKTTSKLSSSNGGVKFS